MFLGSNINEWLFVHKSDEKGSQPLEAKVMIDMYVRKYFCQNFMNITTDSWPTRSKFWI